MKIKTIIDIKLGKFIVVGIINTLIGMLIMFGLYNFAGFSYWVSSAVNYVLTSILSFFLNKHFTFKYRGNHVRSSLKFAINIICCYFLAYGVAKPLIILIMNGFPGVWKDNAAMLLGMCLFTVFNYFGQRMFVFKTDSEN